VGDVPVIRVKEGTYERLTELKDRLKFETYDQVISYLIDAATSPRSFLESAALWAEDVRGDVKSLAEELRRLTQLLSQLKGSSP
jgi:hypothetical protein